jgi:hypothetical protein
MANWYVSSAAYAAIPAWAGTTLYTVGQIIRPTAAVAGKRIAYRCTTGGTTTGTEPTWGFTLGGTTTNGAVFTAINSDTYGWSGAAGDVSTVTDVLTSSFATAGDKIFLSSDHSETTAASTNFISTITGSWTTLTTFLLSVTRAGSVPPVAADLTPGAAITFQALYLDSAKPVHIEGLTLTASAGSICFNQVNYGSFYLKNCALVISSATSLYKVWAADYAEIILDNTSISFAHVAQTFNFGVSVDLTWINTAAPLPGTAVTNLFTFGTSTSLIDCVGVDFSGYSGTLAYANSATCSSKILLEGCKIASSVTLLAGTPSGNAPIIEMVNCWDGSVVRNDHAQIAGNVTTERTIVLTGGATDDIGAFSLKMVSASTKIDKWVAPLETFWFDVENLVTGVSKTATVEIVSSASLNTDDIWLLLEYMGASGTPLVTVANSRPTTALTSSAAVTTSTATWNSSPATPVYQHLQVTFTPQRAGRVRGRVMLGKASTTVYINPVIVIT